MSKDKKTGLIFNLSVYFLMLVCGYFFGYQDILNVRGTDNPTETQKVVLPVYEKSMTYYGPLNGGQLSVQWGPSYMDRWYWGSKNAAYLKQEYDKIILNHQYRFTYMPNGELVNVEDLGPVHGGQNEKEKK